MKKLKKDKGEVDEMLIFVEIGVVILTIAILLIFQKPFNNFLENILESTNTQIEEMFEPEVYEVEI